MINNTSLFTDGVSILQKQAIRMPNTSAQIARPKAAFYGS